MSTEHGARRASTEQRSASPEQATLTPVELAWRAQEVFEREGIEGWARHTWDPEIELDMRPAGIPGIGVYKGAEAAQQFIREWAASFEEWNVQLVEVTPIDDSSTLTVYLQTGTGVESGAPVEMRFAQINDVHEGRATRIRTYTDLEQARREAGLRD